MFRRDRDSGAVAIETALVTGLLLLIVLGAFEYGMGFRSWFGLTAASREGARVGASVGPADGADCAILEAAAAALASTSENEVVRIKIFEHDAASGTDGAFTSYRPFVDAVDDPLLQRCETWFLEPSTPWTETSRDNTGDDRDWLGVEVVYSHAWITGFLWWNGTVQWTNRSVMRLEPVSYGQVPSP
ncbi:MAG TPA: TadE family protein [Acidimicrobiia bacterium]|nr:TadE family protein [Acidimicrobiia bacterium]